MPGMLFGCNAQNPKTFVAGCSDKLNLIFKAKTTMHSVYNILLLQKEQSLDLVDVQLSCNILLFYVISYKLWI